MIKRKKYIKIFALTLFLMISISFNAEVKALTDDNGNEIKCILENTGLENIASRDFCLTFNREIKGIKYALLEQTSYNKNSENYYLQDFKKVILDISELNVGYKYMIFIIPKYNYSDGWTSVVGELKIISNTNDLLSYNLFYKDNHNGNEVGENIKPNEEFRYAYYLPNKTLSNTLLINNNGEWVRLTEQLYDNINSDNKLLFKVNKNKILYTDYVVKDTNGNIIQETTEIRKKIRVEKEIKVNTDESNIINFKIFNLKKDDKIKIIKKRENGTYTESDIIEKTITIDLGENQSYLVKDENIKENKIYDIKVYDKKNEIIYNEEYIHNMKDYVIEDTTEEKEKLINLEDYKINNKLANIIKNVFIIGNDEYLGKIIFLVFTITIIKIIRKMV